MDDPNIDLQSDHYFMGDALRQAIEQWGRLLCPGAELILAPS
jgi:hypothetical protein